MTLTFLVVPESEFLSDDSDMHRWARRIEFLAGLLLSRPYPDAPDENTDGHTIEEIEALVDEYFRDVEFELISSVLGRSTSDPEWLLASAKIHSLHVRGDAYPHQYRAMARDLYAPHDTWFRKNLGLTIEEAIALHDAVGTEYSRRNRSSKERALKDATEQTALWVREGKAPETELENLKLQIARVLHFGSSHEVLGITADELLRCSGILEETGRRFLGRMSQEFGYRNPDFPDTFTDPRAAPWDYNTLFERPLISRDGRFWMVLPSALPAVLFTTFYFDLMGDGTYRAKFEKARGAWLEKQTAACFRRIFPEVLLNPAYPNGEELADVLVLHDRKIFIVQCKSKGLRHESKIGADFRRLKADLEKAVRAAFDQGIRARDYLTGTDAPIIFAGNREFAIDHNQVSAIFIVSVTPIGLQTLTTRFANTNPALQLFRGGEYPWAVSLVDLDILTEILSTPAMFIHYVTRRLHVERTAFQLHADEMDLLGFYIAQGLYFDADEYREFDALSISGLSSSVDAYIFEKHQLGRNPEMPKPSMPPGFESLVADIERLDSPYKTDCAVALLDLSYKARTGFVESFEKAKEEARETKRLNRGWCVISNGRRGLSFIAMDAGGDRGKLFRQVEMFSLLKKHAEKCDEWIGLGWDVISSRAVDIAFYAAYPWRENPVMDELVRTQLGSLASEGSQGDGSETS